MSDREIQKLRGYVEEISKFRDNTVDGNGKNLHDIKTSFDYVIKTVQNYNLEGSKFGSDLASKAGECSEVLSKLWLTLQSLEKSITSFCDSQVSINGQNK